tara:strand:+ start:145 stop:582 length:438 start_codon:yes stop_codon:yes gene_type:complete
MQSTQKQWLLDTVEDTIALGKEMTKYLPRLKLLLLQGSLGAGKTSLVKGIAQNLGITEPITSPTFTLSQHYPTGQPPLLHLDLYRLEKPESANELFLQEEEEAKAINALMVVEWPERLNLDIKDAWHLKIEYLSNNKRIAKLLKP